MAELELRSEVVVPGEELGKKVRRGEYTYLDGDVIKAGVFGLKNARDNDISVIPLAGRYMPKEGDMVVGVVADVNRNGWVIDINAPYSIYLNKERRRDDDGTFDLRRLYKEGDLISVKILEVDEVKNSYVEGPRKLTGGRIVMVNAKKVPRVIGSKKSMLSLLRDRSGCRVVVGQNGIVWIDGPEKNMEVVVEAIIKIEKESHTKGLTDRMGEFLDVGIKKTGAVVTHTKSFDQESDIREENGRTQE